MNCFECKHGKVKFSDLGGVTENMLLVNKKIVTLGDTSIDREMYAGCDAGNNEIIRQFYSDHSHKRKVDVLERLECFEATKGSMLLDSLISTADKLLHAVKEDRSEKKDD
jgi:hypothetical protein